MRARLAIAAATLAAVVLGAVAVAAPAPDPGDQARGIKQSQRPLVFAVVIDGLDGDSVDDGQAPFIS